jgi:hypothetical protein
MTAAPQLGFDFSRRPRRNRAAYFNTTHLHGAELDEARRSARGQDVLVLALFRGAQGPLAPSEAWRQAREAGSDLLLTSVRRSINTLTGEGLLVKREGTRPGPYGRPERLWEAKR